jgi:uncharacterized lipoprotein
VQLTDELEATREMMKADWESWKKLDANEFTDPFYLIRMKMTKTKIVETKG